MLRTPRTGDRVHPSRHRGVHAKARYAHAKARATLLKARLGTGGTMARVLQELRLHQRAEREGVQRELLG